MILHHVPFWEWRLCFLLCLPRGPFTGSLLLARLSLLAWASLCGFQFASFCWLSKHLRPPAAVSQLVARFSNLRRRASGIQTLTPPRQHQAEQGAPLGLDVRDVRAWCRKAFVVCERSFLNAWGDCLFENSIVCVVSSRFVAYVGSLSLSLSLSFLSLSSLSLYLSLSLSIFV